MDTGSFSLGGGASGGGGGACNAATISASCSIAPDSLKSLSTGFLSSLFSTPRDNCDKAITGTPKSRAFLL